MSRYLVPVAGLSVVLAGVLILVFVVTLRPWAGPDQSYDTHLNFSEEVPDGYGRTVPTWTDTEQGAPEGWVAANPASEEDPAYALYVASGCASCHGLTGTEGFMGVDLTEATESEIRKMVRRGEEGMPAYDEGDLSDDQLAMIASYLRRSGGSEQAVAKTPPARPRVAPATAVPASTPVMPATPTGPSAPLATAGPAPTSTPTMAAPPAKPSPAGPQETEESPGATPGPAGPPGGVTLEAAAATIAVDGDSSDWASITGAQVALKQIKPIPGKEMGELPPIDVTLKVAADADNVYVLVEVPDDYDYVADDHGRSAALAVMFRVDEPAAPHMGATEENQRKSLGVVDIWFWQLDCGPGEVSGGGGVVGGNDPACNLDDEYAETPKDLEDDGTRQAENSLTGVWEHSARGQGQGAEGVWTFEISRPLQTGDPQDAQLRLGEKAHMSIAYWDPDETPEGWTKLGHLQSASFGWIEVSLPASPP